jgi:hypothetical protein
MIVTNFEVTGAGFDGGADDTDDRVLWVQAESMQVVELAAKGFRARICSLDQHLSSEEIDFKLPEQEGDFKAALTVFQDLTCVDARPIAENHKLFIEKLGYDIDEDSDQPGLWIWTVKPEGCDISLHTAQEALESAWNHAKAKTMKISGVTSNVWGSMSFEQQKTVMIEALSDGEIVAFD